MPAQKEGASSIYQLKVTLRHIEPPIWRRIQIRGDATLYKLHQTLQIAMGWWNSHMHQFIAGGLYYGEPNPDFGPDMVSERRTRLNQVASGVSDGFIYEYDFGDSWEHEIVVEDLLAPEPRTKYPRCIAGERHCPPEDVGGPWGYEEFLQAIQNEDHSEHEEFVDWIGGSFDPEAFDLQAVNQDLKQIR